MGEKWPKFDDSAFLFDIALIVSVYNGSVWENLVKSTFVPEKWVTKEIHK